MDAKALSRHAAPLALGAALAFGYTAVRAELAAPQPAAAQPNPAGDPARAAAAPAVRSSLSSAALSEALRAARTRNLDAARAARASLADPVARKLVDWAIADVAAEQLSDAELEAAIRGLEGWPRAEARQRALESRRAALPAGPIPYTALADSGQSRSAAFRPQRLRMNEALRAGDAATAYAAISRHGQAPGSVEYADGEFFAGWLALTRLRDPRLADAHFARLEAAVKSPVSKARAAYWRGRAAEAAGEAARALSFYEQGAIHTTTFYGQLAAEKAGRAELVLQPDPTASRQERAAFERAELTQALRLLAGAGERSLLRVFALHYGDLVRSEAELGLLVDTLASLGEQEVSLLAYRRGAQRGLILHERGYPVRTPPSVIGGAEPPLVLAITRQESQFDPRVRSSADARGMMQILPGTGREVARHIGVSWSEELLWDADANMRLGSRYLGQLAERFSGSYPMAAAGYNAGPSRPAQWVQFCGDPRSAQTDPIDFIECIPFSETRNYVMNVMANYQIYRARLNGGRAVLTASEVLRRGPSAGPATQYVENLPSPAAGV